MATQVRVSRAQLRTLRAAHAFMAKHGRFPIPSELCEDQLTLRGAVGQNLTQLMKMGLVSRPGRYWSSATITTEGHSFLENRNKGTARLADMPKSRVAKPRERRVFERKDQVLLHIGTLLEMHGRFPSSTEIATLLLQDERLSSWQRGHVIGYLRQLEASGLITRDGGHFWVEHGRLTEVGVSRLIELRTRGDLIPRRKPYPKRTGGGIAKDGGTRYKDMLVPADQLGDALIQMADRFSKLGPRVRRSKAGGRQRGLRIATFSLEEGRTCDPECALAKICFAGKMVRQRRILYEGLKTDRLVARAISRAGQLHYRINTIGDIPTQSFLEAIFVAIAVTGSTAFGYTHWQPEHPLGAAIRQLSEWHWSFFSIRTSYSDGERAPLSERGAVVVEEFTPEVLERHNALACPEQTGQAKNCGVCGLCWNTRQNIAFKIH